MRKIIGAALAASAAFVGGAHAQETASGPEFSGNVALTTDYVFRGLSQTDEGPAIQGGFDMSYGSFYAGVWASNVDFNIDENIEIDYYGGFKPTFGPVSMDFGLLYYTYPNAGDDGAEYDYWEGKVAGSIAPAENLSLGAAFYYSPEFFGETGPAYYVEANAGFTVTEALSVSGAVGFQSIEELPTLAGDEEDDYTTWNIGAAYSLAGFTFDARYHGANIDEDAPIIESAFTTEKTSDDRVVFTVKRAM